MSKLFSAIDSISPTARLTFYFVGFFIIILLSATLVNSTPTSVDPVAISAQNSHSNTDSTVENLMLYKVVKDSAYGPGYTGTALLPFP